MLFRFLAGLGGCFVGTYVAYTSVMFWGDARLSGDGHRGAGALIGVIMGAATSLAGLEVQRRRGPVSKARLAVSLLGGVCTATVPFSIFPDFFMLVIYPGPSLLFWPPFAVLITVMSMVDLAVPEDI